MPNNLHPKVPVMTIKGGEQETLIENYYWIGRKAGPGCVSCMKMLTNVEEFDKNNENSYRNFGRAKKFWTSR